MHRASNSCRILSLFLAVCLTISCLIGCGINSQHLEMTYDENSNEDIQSWDSAETSDTTTWENASVVYWSDVDEYSDWVYSELLFGEITDEMPIVETRVLDYQSNGKYFDGEKVYQMVGDKFDVNSFVSKYAVGTGVIVICVIMTVVTKGAPQTIACFIAGKADAAISLAAKGRAFGAATRGIITAIKTGGDLEESFYGALEGSADGYMWGAIFGAVTGGFKSQYCFAETTLVRTEKGLQPISSIAVGTKVLSYDEKTGCCFKPVTQVISNRAIETYIVATDNDIIECTATHPFLTTHGWIPASQLSDGDLLLSSNGTYVMCKGVNSIFHTEPVQVFNLCVEGYNCFTVGNAELIVHNRCKPNEKYANKSYHFKEGSSQASKYPNGVPFNSAGYPIFDDYAEITVKFEYPSIEARAAGKCLIGNCDSDFALANKAAGLKQLPAGYTWHHHEDMMTMQLVPQDLHSSFFGGVSHAGGESLLEDFWNTLLSAAIP